MHPMGTSNVGRCRGTAFLQTLDNRIVVFLHSFITLLGGGGGTGMHFQGFWEPEAEAFKSAVAAFYGTQGAKQTSKVNK